MFNLEFTVAYLQGIIARYFFGEFICLHKIRSSSINAGNHKHGTG